MFQVSTCWQQGECTDHRDYHKPNHCIWNFNMEDDCYRGHGLCHVKHGMCQWMRNRQLKVCLKNQGKRMPKKRTNPRFQENINTNEIEVSPYRHGNNNNNNNNNNNRYKISRQVGPPGFMEP